MHEIDGGDFDVLNSRTLRTKYFDLHVVESHFVLHLITIYVILV